MVRIEVDMIVNLINHHHIDHHIIHHQGILYNTLNVMKFSTKRSCIILSINTMNLKMILKIKGWSMEGEGGSLILSLIGEANF